MTTLKRLYLDLPTETVDAIKAKAAAKKVSLKLYVTGLLDNDLAASKPKSKTRGSKDGTRKKAKKR